tara:strand:- start:239 stop:508 length:270 start_codon:yes stop_codon:yes gene_type:complete
MKKLYIIFPLFILTGCGDSLLNKEISDWSGWELFWFCIMMIAILAFILNHYFVKTLEDLENEKLRIRELKEEEKEQKDFWTKKNEDERN